MKIASRATCGPRAAGWKTLFRSTLLYQFYGRGMRGIYCEPLIIFLCILPSHEDNKCWILPRPYVVLILSMQVSVPHLISVVTAMVDVCHHLGSVTEQRTVWMQQMKPTVSEAFSKTLYFFIIILFPNRQKFTMAYIPMSGKNCIL